MTRIKKNISWGIVGWSKTTFPELTSWEGYVAGSEENYSWDLGSERVKILMTTSKHSVVVYLILSSQNKQRICYIFGAAAVCSTIRELAHAAWMSDIFSSTSTENCRGGI